MVKFHLAYSKASYFFNFDGEHQMIHFLSKCACQGLGKKSCTPSFLEVNTFLHRWLVGVVGCFLGVVTPWLSACANSASALYSREAAFGQGFFSLVLACFRMDLAPLRSR
jgi:hypothetical protein